MPIVDFHNHLIPGVDDGATDDEEAGRALAEMWGQEVHTIVATPHLDGTVTTDPASFEARLAQLDEGWARLSALQAAHFPKLKLHRGAEIMLDTPQPDFSDPRVRLAGTKNVLVEFAYMTVPPGSTRVLEGIRAAGYVPVLAHPERYSNVHIDQTVQWRGAGAVLQVNGASLLGRYGSQAKSIALGMLERGLIDVLGSDYHARGSCAISEYRQFLIEAGAEEHASLLTVVNPGRLLEGKPLLPMPGFKLRTGWWPRVRSLLR